jgi:hypothetical protein
MKSARAPGFTRPNEKCTIITIHHHCQQPNNNQTDIALRFLTLASTTTKSKGDFGKRCLASSNNKGQA